MPDDIVRVGRWMGRPEFDRMAETGRVQESVSGTTHVAFPADPAAFVAQAAPGSLYVEFDVAQAAIRPTQAGWAKILGPNTLEGRLAVKKGLPVPQMPPATRIVLVVTKP